MLKGNKPNALDELHMYCEYLTWLGAVVLQHIESRLISEMIERRPDVDLFTHEPVYCWWVRYVRPTLKEQRDA